jgi:enterochelin esterase-like enzyme
LEKDNEFCAFLLISGLQLLLSRLQELLRLRGEERERPGRELLRPEAQGARRQAAVRPPLDEALGGFNLSAFTDMMFTDLIPMIERTSRALPRRESRAMAGLSMGGMQTFTTALNNLDKFAYLGGFSGSCGGRGGTFDPKTDLRRRVRRSSRIQQEGQGAVSGDWFS